MKALVLIAVALLLGAGALYLVLDSGSGRGGREPVTERTSPPEAATERSPASEVSGRTSVPAPIRQSVETTAAHGARAILEGIVIGEGAPIPGADVTLLRRDLVLAESTTDAQGRFRLESQPQPVSTVLRVRARGFVPTERPLAARPAGGTMMLGNLRLMRGKRVTGRVVDVRGRGIPDAEVSLQPMTSGSDVLVGRGRTDAEGRFEIAESPQGRVLATARAQGFGERTIEHTVGGPPLEIRLEPGFELRLLLQEPRGRPVQGVEVTIQAQGETFAGKRVAESDEGGRVVFEGLGAQVWNVRATHPDYRPTGLGQVRADGAETLLECVPWPGIEGVVRAPGGAPPPPGTRVLALPASAPSDRVGAMEGGREVAADGYFRIGGLRAGDWRVQALAPGHAPARSLPVKLGIEGDGYAGTIELAAGSKLSFSIRLGSEPVRGAELELFATPPTPAQLWALASSRGAGLGKRVTSGPDGTAVLENLGAGSVWVAVYAEGCPPRSSGPHLVPEAPTSDSIPIALERGARIAGQVRGANGAPAARAQLRLVEIAGRLGFPLTLVSGEDGRYTSGWLPAGQYTVEAFAPEDATRHSGTETVTLQSGEERTLDLTL